jgi:helix-hairpin-helix protein
MAAGRLGRSGSGRRVAAEHAGPIPEKLPAALLAVRYIGPRRARRLIDALGSDWEALLNQAPVRVFGTLRGVGPRQARAAAQSWRSGASLREGRDDTTSSRE